jgi:hypothetical protein
MKHKHKPASITLRKSEDRHSWRLFLVAGTAEFTQDRKTGVAPTKKPYRRLTVRLWFFGADEVNRTPDPHITNVLLYRLSYIGDKQPL